MAAKRLRLLLVEDSEDDARLLLRELERGGYQVESTRVETQAAMQAALDSQTWDVVVSDYSLPQFSAPQALDTLQVSNVDLPFIIVSGTIGEDTAVAALKAGAHDFLIKNSLARLIPAIERELKDAETRRERKRAEEVLRQSEDRFRSLFENTPVSIWEEDFSAVKILLDALKEQGISDLDAYLTDHPELISKCLGLVKVIDVNRMALNLFGAKDKEELLDGLEKTASPDTHNTFKQELLAIASGRHKLEMDITVHTLTGKRRETTLNWAVVPGYEESYSRVLISFVDITELKQHEHELVAIVSVSEALRTVKTLSEMLSRLLKETIDVLGAESGSIWLYDPSTDLITLAGHQGWGSEQLGPLKRGQQIPGLVVQRGKAVVSREFHTDPAIEEENRVLIPPGIGGACVPLHVADTVVGSMFINVRLPRELTADEARVLNALAEIGGSAIHRMRLLEKSIRQVDRLSSLRTIDLAISGSFDLRLSLNTVLEQMLSQLAVDAASVLLIRPGMNRLEYVVGQGFRTRAIASTSLRLGEGYAGQAALEKKIVHIKDLTESTDNSMRRDFLTDEEFISYFAVPLIAKGEVKGVLEIFNRTPLHVDMDWLDFLDSLSWQTALAVDNALLFEKIQRSNFDLELAYDATIEGWSKALDLRDKETEGHTQRVTEMTVKLAQAMGFPDIELVHIKRGALLHDIGKMGVPDNILLKPDQLTEDEWKIMKQHPQLAYDMLQPITYLKSALDIPYCHHEKWDGSGYPRGLSKTQIPLQARMFAIVDVWDAVTSDRPYRKAWTAKKALSFIREQSGKHFDPDVVDVFLREIVKESGSE
jgi:response regulator RpfG family c-di-GMP phosphodiesterase